MPKKDLKSILEYTIGKLSQNINVKVDIDKTQHASDRQHRQEDTRITDDEIIETVRFALDDIANMLVFDEINMGQYVLVKNTKTDLNIIGALHPGQNDEIDFVVVTVMRKHNFMPKQGTKVIKV